MEPAWELVCERIDDSRTLSNRDRALFGLVRLAGDDARHLAWGQGSVLSRLTGDTNEAAASLAKAYHTARDSAKLDTIKSLTDAAGSAETFARNLGAYVDGAYEPGLELGRSGLSAGSIALHDSGVPLRLAGLGSRRLATLAIQKSAIVEGAIVLIDEIEHGLEPHRIIGAISQLKSDQEKAVNDAKPVGQILMTTHSDVALGESGENSLHVVKINKPERIVSILTPSPVDSIRPLLRFTPRALLAKRILVCEGNTEVGLLLGLREYWPERHNNKPIEHSGSAFADGNGGQACSMALALSSLGYTTAIYRDSDEALSAKQKAKLAAADIQIFEYGNTLYTELAILRAASDESVQSILEFARDEKGTSVVSNALSEKIADLTSDDFEHDFTNWDLVSSMTSEELRIAIAEAAATKGMDQKTSKHWFKDQRIGRELAPLVWDIAEENPASPLAKTLEQIESWLYA